jgi:RND family efflux transporter MFP subunit
VDAKIQQAQADVAGSKTYLSYLRIVAPFNGVVTKRYVDPGTMAAPGVPLFTVEDDSHLQLEVSMPESLRWRIMEESPILVDVEAAGIRQSAVKPLETPAGADAATRSFLFKLELPDSSRLRSGMFGRARFPVGSRQVLQIPETCLVRQGQLEGIFTIGENGIVEWRLVKTGAIMNNSLEILSGLKVGEKVVDNPPTDLVAGDIIEVRS